jgi:FtsZ-binding cell division protein ZapB
MTMERTVALLLALVLLMGCTDTSELDNKIKSLEAERSSLEKTKTDLTQEAGTLRKERDDLRKERDDLKEKYDAAAKSLESYQSAAPHVTDYAIDPVENSETIGQKSSCKNVAIRTTLKLNNTGKVAARDLRVTLGAKVGNLTLISDEESIPVLPVGVESDVIEIRTKPSEALCKRKTLSIVMDEIDIYIKFRDDRPKAGAYRFWIGKEEKKGHEATGDAAAKAMPA